VISAATIQAINQGFEVVGSAPAEFAAYVKSEIPKWAKVVKTSGAVAE